MAQAKFPLTFDRFGGFQNLRFFELPIFNLY